MDKSKMPRLTVATLMTHPYESPIKTEPAITDAYKAFEQYGDAAIYQAVLSYKIEVDQDELRKALAYDRDQYAAGYRAGLADGKEAGYAEGLHHAWNMVREAIGGAKDAD